MAKTDLFITFTVPYVNHYDEKFAVRCKDMEQAREVAYDADSLYGITNIRLRRCGKPKDGRRILEYNDYWKYSKWY